jgi:hypothetical protein
MRKMQFAVVFALFLTMAVIGCASNAAAQTGTTSQSGNNANPDIPAVAQTSTTGQSANKANPDIPDWYLNPPEDPNYIYGIGSAKMSNSDRSRRTAEHRARNSLTFQLNAYVKAMEVDYGKEAGTTNNMAVSELFENVDLQLAAAALKNANISKRFVASDGTQYALIIYPRNSAVETVKGVIENAASKTATIQKDIALKDMDKAFAEISKPQPVDTGE